MIAMTQAKFTPAVQLDLLNHRIRFVLTRKVFASIDDHIIYSSAFMHGLPKGYDIQF